jgi:hypothetical protein
VPRYLKAGERLDSEISVVNSHLIASQFKENTAQLTKAAT